MSATDPPHETTSDLFEAARAYDQSINWKARIDREIPVLREVFGPPGVGGLLDAGCGTAHQAIELTTLGYTVTGADKNEAMLAVAQENAAAAGATSIRFVESHYGELFEKTGGGFDGVFCQGNALAAAGTSEGVKEAIDQFAQCLRVGGKVFVQILNFRPLQEDVPCVRGPRVSTAEGIEYVSVREFHRDGESIQVTNISLWQENGTWHQRSNCGFLYPIAPIEIREWFARSNLQIEHIWGAYDRSEFDESKSVDIIVVAKRI